MSDEYTQETGKTVDFELSDDTYTQETGLDLDFSLVSEAIVTNIETIEGIARISVAPTKTRTSESRIRIAYLKGRDFISRTLKSSVLHNNSVARVRESFSETDIFKSRVLQKIEKSLGSIGKTVIPKKRLSQFDAFIKLEKLKSIGSNTYLLFEKTKDVLLDSRIKKKFHKTINLSAQVGGLYTVENYLKSSVLKEVKKGIESSSRIVGRLEKNLPSISRISISSQDEEPLIGRIKKGFKKVMTLDGRISLPRLASRGVKSLIRLGREKRKDLEGRVSKAYTVFNSFKGLVSKLKKETNNIISRIRRTSEKTISLKAWTGEAKVSRFKEITSSAFLSWHRGIRQTISILERKGKISIEEREGNLSVKKRESELELEEN